MTGILPVCVTFLQQQKCWTAVAKPDLLGYFPQLEKPKMAPYRVWCV